MVLPSLPPGFRFHPTDVELIGYYLKRKVMGNPFHLEAIAEIELYKFAPWDLPENSLLRCGDLEWYFFCPQDRKYPNSTRRKRATAIGYWKPTGNDRPIIQSSRTIGKKKTLIFYLGKSPKGDRTDWVMYEYRLEDPQLLDAGSPQDAYVLCKIFQKSGLGSKIGEQYGAPFNEKEWESDATEDSTSLLHMSCPSLTLLGAPTASSAFQEPLATYDSDDVSPDPNLSDIDGLWLEELAELLNESPVEENGMNKMPDSEVFCKTATNASAAEPSDVYEGSEDLSAMMLRNWSYTEGMTNEYGLLPVSSDLGEDFLELNDFLEFGESDIFKLNDPFGQHAPVQGSNYGCQNNMHYLVSNYIDVTSTALED